MNNFCDHCKCNCWYCSTHTHTDRQTHTHTDAHTYREQLQDSFWPHTNAPNKTVEKAPPMKPSQVFLGDSLISGVLPKKNPNMYAMMSLQMIIETGTSTLQLQICVPRKLRVISNTDTPVRLTILQHTLLSFSMSASNQMPTGNAQPRGVVLEVPA